MPNRWQLDDRLKAIPLHAGLGGFGKLPGFPDGVRQGAWPAFGTPGVALYGSRANSCPIGEEPNAGSPRTLSPS